jgi:hypothetical protein
VPGTEVKPSERDQIYKLAAEGLTQAEIARITHRSPHTIRRIVLAMPRGVYAKTKLAGPRNPPKGWDELTPLGKDCLRDFSLFSRVFFVRDIPPWRAAAATKIIDALLDEDQRYILMNTPVGSGKSSLLRDVGLWAIAGGGSDPSFGRSLRIAYGHAVLDKAQETVDLMRRILSDPLPYFDHKKKAAAEHSLLELYGRFRPLPSDDDAEVSWRVSKFTVASIGDAPVANKEATVQAISYGSTFVGERPDLIILDDIVSPKNVNDPDFLVWLEMVEDRLEPGGLIVMLGQRISVNDPYARVLERSYSEDDGEATRIYEHVAWPAHNDETCDGSHRQWDLNDDGCLLDELRIPWAKIRRESQKLSFHASYQQTPETGTSGLIRSVHFQGGRDEDGVEFPGVLDRNRGFRDFPALPERELKDLVVYASVDPSGGAGAWAVEVFATRTYDGPRWLLWGTRRPMQFSDFLGIRNSTFAGLMSDLQIASRSWPSPIKVWVIEDNLMSVMKDSLDFRLFQAAHQAAILWHHTGSNRSSTDFGLEALLQPLFREGRLRVPYLGREAQAFARELESEATSYPLGRHTDAIMATWFAEVHIREILTRASRPHAVPNIPSLRSPYLQRQRQEYHTCFMCRQPMNEVRSLSGQVVALRCPNGHEEPRTAGLGGYATGNQVADMALSNAIQRVDLERRKR